MSSAANAAVAQQAFIEICCSVSATALLVYEYFITFDREYQLVWKRRFSAATLIFLVGRYSMLLALIFDLITIYPLSLRSCSAMFWLSPVFDLLFLLLVAAFSSLRAYALTSHQRQIALLIFILSLVPGGVDLFLNVWQIVVVAPPPVNCTGVPLFSPELSSINRILHVLEAAAEANLRTSLHTVILRDGTVYFLAMLMMNIADILFLYFGETFEGFAYIDQFINPITAILISRFLLNLREIDASQRSNEDSSRPSFVGSVQFEAFVEPLGAPLDHEFSFSATDRSSLVEQRADREGKPEDMLDNDEEMELGQISFHEPSEAEAGPSGFRE